MKKIIVNKPGGYMSLSIKTEDDPTPGVGEYVVDVKYIGVNYADIIVREGYYTAAKGLYPLVPGFEFSGTIQAVGEGAARYKVGDTVCGITRFGGYATKISARESSLRPVPQGWTAEEAAALLVPHLTAYHGLRNVAHAKSGETILVHSAAGGVGTALLQQAKAMGCKPIAVVGNSEKVEVAQRFGAYFTVVKERDFWAQLDKHLPDGFDAIFDANGLTTPTPGYDRLKLGGRLVIYGFAELFPRGKRPWLPTLAYRALRVPKFRIRKMTSTNRTIAGFNIAFLFERVDLSDPALDDIMRMAASGDIQKPIIKTFAFTEIVEAHKYIESGNSAGRVVLKV